MKRISFRSMNERRANRERSPRRAALHPVRPAAVLLKMLGEEAVQEDPGADALAKAKELLGGVDSAID